MLALTVVEEIDRLLQESRLSQRKIAARLGVSRSTVSAIANGRRDLFGRDPTLDMPNATTPSLPAERCPRCGFKVYMPCLVCQAREFRDARRLQHELASLAGHLKLRRQRRVRVGRGRRPRRSRVA